MENQLDKEQLELCRLLSLALHDELLEKLNPDVDYERVIAIAESHKVTSLLYPVLEEKNLQENVWSVVKNKGEQAVQQSYRLLMLSRYVIGLLKENGIDTVLLKGCGTAAWYPVPELRKSGDVDLLLGNEEEATKAVQILNQKGFVTAGDQRANHHIVCVSPDRISIELHISLAEPFDNDKTNRFLAEKQKHFFQNRRKVDSMGITFELMSDAYHAFYLLLHMLQHFMRAGFGIKLLCDWVVFWEKNLTDEEKETFLNLVRESGTLGFARMMTNVCVRYLGLKKEKVLFLLNTEDALEKKTCIQLTEELIEEIFEAEEFGKSSSNRMVVLRGTRLIDFIREFHHQMKLTYPKASKCGLLYPILWIMTFFGFLYRNKKVRKISSKQIFIKAKKRSRLVKKMKLFQ